MIKPGFLDKPGFCFEFILDRVRLIHNVVGAGFTNNNGLKLMIS
jgi:hypothetical protein